MSGAHAGSTRGRPVADPMAIAVRTACDLPAFTADAAAVANEFARFQPIHSIGRLRASYEPWPRTAEYLTRELRFPIRDRQVLPPTVQPQRGSEYAHLASMRWCAMHHIR